MVLLTVEKAKETTMYLQQESDLIFNLNFRFIDFLNNKCYNTIK